MVARRRRQRRLVAVIELDSEPDESHRQWEVFGIDKFDLEEIFEVMVAEKVIEAGTNLDGTRVYRLRANVM